MSSVSFYGEVHLGRPFVKSFVLIPALDLLSVFISLDSVLIDFY